MNRIASEISWGEINFPDGCTYCDGKIIYEEENKMFVCSNYPKCESYVHAHAQSNGFALKDRPVGILADNSLRKLHAKVRKEFNKLWRDAIINEIEGIIYQYEIAEEMCYGRVLVTEEDKFVLSRLFTNETDKIEKNKTGTIPLRTKSYLWLAEKLGVPYENSGIPWMDKETAYKALNILNQTIRQYGE